jgi:flagellar biosynthesis protein FlhA
MRSIAEALAHTAVRTKDADELTAAVRLALGRSIVQRIIGNTDELPLIALDATLEQILHKAVQQEGSTAIEPELAARLVQALREIVRQQERDGIPSVLVVSPEIRHWISGWLRASIAGLNVLAYTEIPDNRGVKVIATVGPTTLPSPEKHDSGGIAVGGA